MDDKRQYWFGRNSKCKKPHLIEIRLHDIKLSIFWLKYAQSKNYLVIDVNAIIHMPLCSRIHIFDSLTKYAHIN